MTRNEEKDDQSVRIPLLEEDLEVAKQIVDGDRLTVETSVDERIEWARETVINEKVSIERVPIGRAVTDPPRIREEDNVTIIPIVREVLRVEKQLILVEELHVTRQQSAQKVEEPVSLRSMRAKITRTSNDENGNPQRAEEDSRS